MGVCSDLGLNFAARFEMIRENQKRRIYVDEPERVP